MTWSPVRTLGLRTRYLAKGDAWTLYRHLDDLPGIRGVAEKVVLPVLSAAPFRRGLLTEAQQVATNILEDTFSVGAGLLLWTAHYKPTWFVGPVRLDTLGLVFLKHYKCTGEARAEGQRVDQLASVLPRGLHTVRVESLSAGLVQYGLVERESRRASRIQLEQAALKLGVSSLQHDSVALLAGPADLADLLQCIAAETSPSTAAVMEELVLSAEGLPAPIAHGDFTPWNVICSPGKQLTLVDCEWVGHWPAFYDIVHLHLQVAAQREAGVSNLQRVSQLIRESGEPNALQAVIVAGTWDVLHTARQHLAHPENRLRTSRALRVKIRALSACDGRL